jgi:hypothetical protein
MKSRQFCSVCKEWLEMEVVPTSDGEEDDGVIWFRCPQCQGFLPKLSGAELKTETPDKSGLQEDPSEGDSPDPETGADEALPWDSPADMMAAREKTKDDTGGPDLAGSQDVEAAAKSSKEEPSAGSKKSAKPPEPAEPPEPIHEYAAMLAEKDQSQPTPYRPWETYEVGQCIHHQAWEDCGVVVAKEKLPGGRQVIKCYFEEAGVVRLIEKAPQ